MLPIYEALEVIEVISEKAGHTKPWVVSAKTPDGVKLFVTKLYSTFDVNQSNCVTKEVICNLLAREFDLDAPQCVLIDIPEYLTFKLSPEAQYQYENADHRLKFATLKLENVIIAIPQLAKKQFQRRISMDTLFAFDNLIRNADRGFDKTNLLLSPKTAHLIDHERAFSEKDIRNINIDTLQLEDSFTKYHLFFPYLHKSRFVNKQSFFNDFSYYLNTLKINKLNNIFSQLRTEGFLDYSEPIYNWIDQVKQNSTIFVDKLKGAVR
jgi:hypothetical protein